MGHLTVPVTVVALVIIASVMHGQTPDRDPSRSGAADRRAAKRITPAKVIEARNLITRGTIYRLGRVHEHAHQGSGSQRRAFQSIAKS